MGAAKFEIVIGPNNLFQWKYIGPDGKDVLASQGFGNKDDAFAAIRGVKENATFNERYERRSDNGSKCSFRLKNASHQVLATSGLYEKEEDRETAISVLRRAPEAAVMDKTI